MDSYPCFHYNLKNKLLSEGYFINFVQNLLQMSNEFKIKILTDSSGNEVALNSIPIDAAAALSVFIESLTAFAKSYDDGTDIKLALENGCIETSIVFPEEEEYIAEDIDDIISGRSYDNYRIKLFKDMQDKILQNGLTYQVFLKQNQDQEEVTDYFKGKKFPIRRSRNDKEYQMVFLEGFLYEAGGKSKTNVHIQIGDEEHTIECTRDQAKRLNERLYSTVYIAATKKMTTNKADKYVLIDSYLKEESFKAYKALHESIFNSKTLEKYDILHYYMRDIIISDSIENEELIKIIRLYNQFYIDRGILRTILMTLKPIIKNNEGLTPYYDRISETFRSGSKNKRI